MILKMEKRFGCVGANVAKKQKSKLAIKKTEKLRLPKG